MCSEFDCFRLSIDLKQCFRLNILETDDANDSARKMEELEHRVTTFWHWRVNLLLVLNKFGKSLGGQNNMVLYHRANARMLVKVCFIAFSLEYIVDLF